MTLENKDICSLLEMMGPLRQQHQPWLEHWEKFFDYREALQLQHLHRWIQLRSTVGMLVGVQNRCDRFAYQVGQEGCRAYSSTFGIPSFRRAASFTRWCKDCIGFLPDG